MPTILISDEYGSAERINLLCTFIYKRGFYFLEMTEDGQYSAGKFSFSIFEGVHESSDDLSDRVIAISNMLIRCHNAEPQKYRFEGENYIISDADSAGVKLRKGKRPLFFLRFIRPSAIIVKFIIAMLMAWGYAFTYVNMSGMKWLLTTFPSADRNGLRIMLYVVEMVGALLLFILRKNDRTIIDLFLNAILPANIFTVVGLAKSDYSTCVVVLIAVASFICFKAFPRIINAVREKKSEEKLKLIADIFKKAYTPALILICICIVVSKTGLVIGISAKSSADTSDLTEQVISEQYIDACEKINAMRWYELSEQEQVDALQAICDYECKFELGCEPVKVVSAYLDSDELLGQYNHLTKTIFINQSHIKNDMVADVVDTLIHETRHAYQHALAEALDRIEPALDGKAEKLSVFRYASDMRDNLVDYTDADVNYDGYFEQEVECDSRHWAELRMYYTYLNYIYS